MTDREPMKNDVPELWRQRAKAGLCPVCGKTPDQFKKRMRVYCSPKCRDKYAEKYTYWSVERNKFLREHGKICDNCGTTPEKTKQLREQQYQGFLKEWLLKPENIKILEEKRDESLVNLSERFEQDYNEIMDDKLFFNKTFWDEKYNLRRKITEYGAYAVDHITALCNGGDMWDKKNWQVLCSECHKKKTIKDLRERKRLKNNNTKLEI